MIRRSFLSLGAMLPFLGIKAEEAPRFPNSVPGFPEVTVRHVHFKRSELPSLEFKSIKPHGRLAVRHKRPDIFGRRTVWESVTVPLFHINAQGKVISWRNRKEAAPLTDPVVQRGLVENMVACTKAAIKTSTKWSGTLMIVTSDHPDNKNGVGLCFLENTAPDQIFRYGRIPI